MLRFDLPQVWSNVIRWEAFVTFIVCWLALLVTPWVLALLIVMGFVRGFLGHHRCPSHWAWKRIAMALGWAGRKEDAGAKMFANKMLFVASTAAFTLFVLDIPFWKVPTGALVLFSFLEWALSFCAACWVYGAWYKRFPPSGA